ncbi:DMT family transporter [Leptolyngbya sp. GB1-A1]|uniref:DMT family transporter n=1 Tax=Leptolyngbya sp. GB1-A1 TaxID=2933908 RepID=UPI0032998FE8
MLQKQMGVREWGLLITLSVLWGGSFLFIKLALTELPPFTIVFSRVSLAAIVLTFWVWISGQPLLRSLQQWQEFLVMGALNNLIPFSLIAWGQTQINSSLAAILNATTPIFAVILAHWLTQDERLTPDRFAGTVLGLGGVVVLMSPQALSQFNLTNLAQLAILGAACSYGLAGIYGKRFRSLSPPVAAAGMLIGTSVMMLPLVLIIDRPWTLAPDSIAVFSILGLSLLSTALAYLIYFQLLATAGSTNLLLVTFLIPISALVLGVLVLKEQVQWTEVIGMGLIFLGLIAIDGRFQLRRQRSA